MTPHDGSAPTNAISFDLEHWYSATLLQPGVADPSDRIEESVDIVLDVLGKHDVRATFFAVGEVAEEYPHLLERIRTEGHEIGTHGHTHTPLFELTPAQFETELERATAAIERATGVEPIGFRAPNFSVTRETAWAFEILESAGYRYDSSVFPMRTPLYGVSGAPTRPYPATPRDPFRPNDRHADSASLVEYPVSVIDSLVRLPIGGGFYARVLPGWFLQRGIERLNRKGIPANLYFHPWEFNSSIPGDSWRDHRRFVSFYGRDRLERKLGHLLGSYSFNTLRTVLSEKGLLDLEGGQTVERLAETNE